MSYKWKFTLNDYTLKYSIFEWKEFGVSFGRENKTGFVKSYLSQITLIKEDAVFLRNIVYSDLNANVSFKVFSIDLSGASALVYSAFLDLSIFEDSIEKVKVGVYEGGFFSLLDNWWGRDIEIVGNWDGSELIPPMELVGGEDVGEVSEFDFSGTSVQLPIGMGNFEDVLFDGGEYRCDEVLGLPSSAISLTTGSGTGDQQYENYMPILKKNTENDKLKFFNHASGVAIKNNDILVTPNNCFIDSPLNINGGTLTFEGKACAKFVFPDLLNNLINDESVVKKIKFCQLHFVVNIFIYNREKTMETWRPTEHSLSGLPLAMPLTVVYPCRIGKSSPSVFNAIIDNVDLAFYDDAHHNENYGSQSYNLFKNIINLDSYIHQNNVGYRVALDINAVSAKFWGDSGYAQNISYELEKQVQMYVNDNFSLRYSYGNFNFNKNRVIHGMRVKEVLHKILTKINNNKYNVNIDLSISGIDYIILFSGIGLRGSMKEAFDNFEKLSIITSLEKILNFLYLKFNLKLVAFRNNDTYSIKLVKHDNCYSDEVILNVEKTNSLSIKPISSILYTAVDVGWNNDNSSIFGLYEFNTTNTFTTEYTNLKENVLSLVNEYVGGCFDFETYVHENYNNFSDGGGDGDGKVFVAELEGNKIKLDTIKNNNDIKKAINVSFTPKRILENHTKEIASFLLSDKILKFNLSKRNANFEHNGIIENEYFQSDYNTSEIYIPFIAEFSAPVREVLFNKILVNPYGLVNFKHNGQSYSGYIAVDTSAVVLNAFFEKENKFKIMLKK